MISVEEAKKLIIENTSISENSEEVHCELAAGKILAEDIFSPTDLPPFRQAAMDGYGIALTKETQSINHKVIAEVRAGDYVERPVDAQSAVRIFTGARVPDDVNCLVIQENVNANNDTITSDKADFLKPMANIRPQGEQVQKGALALKKGTLLTPASVGYLNSMGIEKIKVIKPAKIGILVTGDELQKPGSALDKAQVYESNSGMLKSVLHYTLGLKDVSIHFVKDDFNSVKETIDHIFKESDLLLVTGGISAGKYDFVKRALEELGVNSIFYKIAQKPGKPLYFGKKASKAVFGLPGNPAAALTCYYQYVYPYLKKHQGHSSYFLPEQNMTLKNSFAKKPGLAMFLKAKANGSEVEISQGQASSMLHTFSEANAFVYLPSETGEVKTGEPVKVNLLNH
ncbi:molybdopterin molybdotransferase MoeA [Cytophagaceae bacterium ABcell3]|nr:molybdopterin molybdotransferase MoeA [Cytophagaceae bacterium ABcell3]